MTDQSESGVSKVLAFVLDDLIPIPGTRYRIGLDPIVGLVPGVGDASTTAAGSVLLVRGVQKGIPRIVLARMVVNLLLNGIIGAVPFLGDVFSAWFKSNRRNYELLQKHQTGKRKAGWKDWVVVSVVLLIVFAIAVGVSLLVAWAFYAAFQSVYGGE